MIDAVCEPNARSSVGSRRSRARRHRIAVRHDDRPRLFDLESAPHAALAQSCDVRCAMLLNYGFDRIRFTGPVRSGSRIRGRFTLSKTVRNGADGAETSVARRSRSRRVQERPLWSQPGFIARISTSRYLISMKRPDDTSITHILPLSVDPGLAAQLPLWPAPRSSRPLAEQTALAYAGVRIAT